MPGAHPLCCEACLHLFLLTRLALYVTGLVCLFSSLGLPSVLHGLCALQGFMSASLLAPQACSLHCEVHVGCRVCTLGLSWHPRPTLYAMGFLWASISSLSLPSGQGYSLWAVYGLRSAAFSVFCPLSPCFAWLSEILQHPLGPAYKGASQCKGTGPPSKFPSSLRTQALVQKFFMSSHFMSPSSLLPHFRELRLPPLEAWLLLLSPRVCFVGVVPYLDEFWCICGEAGDVPILLFHRLLPLAVCLLDTALCKLFLYFGH